MRFDMLCVAVLIFFMAASHIGAQEDAFPVLKGPYLGQKPPGDTPQLFAPGLISDPDSKEMGCTWTPDMKEFYFTRQGTSENTRAWAIWFTREIDEKWTRPEIVEFSGKHMDIAPFITFDGKYMLFYRGSHTDTSIKRGTYITERVGDSWSEPRFFDNAYVLTTANFKDFFCTIDSANGEINRQIACMIYNDGSFSGKMPVKGQLNTESFEAHSYISPRGDYMLFDSNRPGGFDEIDVYVSFMTDNKEWSEGVNLGEKINRGQFTIPSLTPDAKYLFLNADGNIYWVEAGVIETLRPED